MRVLLIAFAVLIGFVNPPIAAGQSSDPLFEAGKAPETGTLFISTDSGQPVSRSALDAALSESSVIGRLASGEAARFLGLSIESGTDSMVLLGASADVVYAACLKGSIHSAGIVAKAGQLIMWQPGIAAPVIYDFDMRRYLSSSSLRFNPEIQAELEKTVSDQEEQMYWGALQRTSTNVQSLSSPITEQMRRDYLRRPAIMRLRLKSTTHGALARGVAETFAAALASGDKTTIADLLNPGLFSPKGEGQASGDWKRFRRAFAERLAGWKWSSDIDPASLKATDNVGVWQVTGGSTDYLITLDGYDGMTFVTSVKPATGDKL